MDPQDSTLAVVLPIAFALIIYLSWLLFR